MLDLIIRGATVIDGLGRDPQRGDVGVRDGRVAAVGAVTEAARETVDADGLTLCPGFVDLHTHYDAQITWDPTLSPSPSLGVTTAVMGNCGFGIVPAPPQARDLIMRNLSVVEGMDLDALRAGIDWRFESFADYLDAAARQGPYLNVATFIGHSVVRTAVMGEAASQRRQPTAEELARMRAIVGAAMADGAIGFASSYSPSHSGYGGVPMPSTITEPAELDALVGAMGDGPGVVQIASGAKPVDEIAALAGRHGRRIFMTTSVAMFNARAPERAIGYFEAAGAAQARGEQVHIQIPCQPLTFDFTLANAYPFHSHDAFGAIKGYTREQLMATYRDASFRERFRANLTSLKPGALFHGNWEHMIVGETKLAKNAGLTGQSVRDVAAARGADPLDVAFDLGLEENLETGFLGYFLNVGDEGVGHLLRHPAGVVSLSDAGAHLIYMCDAGYGLHFLSRWVRELGVFDLVEGVRRLTSHPADLYGIAGRGRIAVGAQADLLLFDPATVGVTPTERIRDLPGGGRRTIRRPRGVHGVWVNGVPVFDGSDYVKHTQGPGQVLRRFARPAETATGR
ncbi:MAG: amidohydrolase family protein [Alphaproteobacteria bacterium]